MGRDFEETNDYAEVFKYEDKIVHSIGLYGVDGEEVLHYSTEVDYQEFKEGDYDSIEHIPNCQLEDIERALDKQELSIDFLRDDSFDDGEIL